MGDGFSLICETVTGFVIIFGLIFAMGVVVSQVGAVVAGARWVDVLRHGAWWVNSLVDFYGLICLVWIDFCVVRVVFVMGWGMFKGISINLDLNFFFFFFFFGTESGFVVCSSHLFSLKFMGNEKP